MDEMAEAARVLERAAEKALMDAAAGGDRLAQRQIFERLKVPVHRTLYRIMGSNAAVPDLVQDTYVEVFRSAGSFKGESSLARWADVIASRVAYRYLRRRPPPATHLSLVRDLPDRSATPESTVGARHALRALYAILDRLDPKYRIAYALHVVDGRPLREVAEITGVTHVAAKNRVWRARHMVEERARREPYLRAFLDGAGENS